MFRSLCGAFSVPGGAESEYRCAGDVNVRVAGQFPGPGKPLAGQFLGPAKLLAG
ncbi:hypothetical protein GCM10010347_46930 [Streptomyces cirratus]|uniref:Uncharacterized protein n=1 Tax=Streptomyces cirratus TaxID=68187 RepID=A0ABQ3F271_9ACTN|nr:hypothetical protein GCM10010347_46930 [Streptomyces cirratus]